MRMITLLGFSLVLLSQLGSASRALQRDNEPRDGAENGVEVLARGPIHEAFAEPVMRRQGAGEPVAKKPPEPINEIPPEQKPEGDNSQWIPGYWAWDDDRSTFLWVSGIWRVPPPNRHWVPGYWLEADEGWRWVSGYWMTQGETQVDLLPAPPDPVEEAVPAAPDDNSGYVPGCWVYAESGYAWRPGFWVSHRPGWTWISAGYVWTPGGYVFVDGYWDYDLSRRGLCFAPVIFDSALYRRPGWSYRPNYVVAADLVLSALFVNNARHHYYFGDYYDPRYARRGYEPWVDYRVHDRAYDPLFSYYRWRNRENPRWEADLKTVYATRRDRPADRPARTLIQQQGRAGESVSHAITIAPLNQVKSTAFKLQPVPPAHHQELQRNAEHLRSMSQERGRIEMHARNTAVTRPVTPPTAPAIRTTPPTPPARVTPPTPPAAPTHIQIPRPAVIIKPPTGAAAAPPHPVHPPTQPKPQQHEKDKHK